MYVSMQFDRRNTNMSIQQMYRYKVTHSWSFWHDVCDVLLCDSISFFPSCVVKCDPTNFQSRRASHKHILALYANITVFIFIVDDSLSVSELSLLTESSSSSRIDWDFLKDFLKDFPDPSSPKKKKRKVLNAFQVASVIQFEILNFLIFLLYLFTFCQLTFNTEDC